jgi:hypothetical protein
MICAKPALRCSIFQPVPQPSVGAPTCGIGLLARDQAGAFPGGVNAIFLYFGLRSHSRILFVSVSKRSSSISKSGATSRSLRRWAAQWRFAAIELPKQKARELRALTEKQAIDNANMLLDMKVDGWTPPHRRISSGFVDQQRLFARLAAK